MVTVSFSAGAIFLFGVIVGAIVGAVGLAVVATCAMKKK